jgi:hypothetical protein
MGQLVNKVTVYSNAFTAYGSIFLLNKEIIYLLQELGLQLQPYLPIGDGDRKFGCPDLSDSAQRWQEAKIFAASQPQ